MTKRVFVTLALVLAIAGCSRIADSRLNPFNWFGSSQEVRVAAATERTVDPRGLVQQVISFEVERNAGGAILRATGLPPVQGYWDGELVAENGEVPVNGVLTYQFRIAPPPRQTRVSTQRSREVVVARFVSDQKLIGVSQIRIVGSANARTARR